MKKLLSIILISAFFILSAQSVERMNGRSKETEQIENTKIKKS